MLLRVLRRRSKPTRIGARQANCSSSSTARQYLNAIEGAAAPLPGVLSRIPRRVRSANARRSRSAYEKYDDDPDILIAMYRMPGADDGIPAADPRPDRQDERVVSQRRSTSPPRTRSKYNQWAWLVSNTEGDYAKAVEHSLHSLELSPDEPSYLDTLGRCYFSAGDLENAIKIATARPWSWRRSTRSCGGNWRV